MSEAQLYTLQPVLNGPQIKPTPINNWTPAGVPKFSSTIYCQINLHSVAWLSSLLWSFQSAGDLISNLNISML